MMKRFAGRRRQDDFVGEMRPAQSKILFLVRLCNMFILKGAKRGCPFPEFCDHQAHEKYFVEEEGGSCIISLSLLFAGHHLAINKSDFFFAEKRGNFYIYPGFCSLCKWGVQAIILQSINLIFLQKKGMISIYIYRNLNFFSPSSCDQ